ncbi:MAG: beta-lactamase family protein [Acidobacteriota bacterium]|nr:beta-lactamase family protein [Acidobacteriota bacterium]
MKFNHRAILSSSALLLASLTVPGIGQQPSNLPAIPPSVQTGNASSLPAPPASAPAAMTAEDVAAFLDGVVPLQLKRENLAGAVVLVVKDGKVLYSKGYGYSDVKTQTPMSADENLVRVGSVSKLFTWTAVMQLVEQKKINLDEDVNTYLDFKIPATYPKPITMRNLMTHTAGFEEVIQDLIGDNPKQIIPLGTYLKQHLPERVFAPGSTPAYSNYGATLAGYIVQRVSGMPFDDYVEKNIFEPLQMQHATFRQPLPENLAPMLSHAYNLASEPAKPFEIVVPAPAGSVSATAENMSHFMLAHLQGGTYNGKRILGQDTANLMHSRQYAPNPAVNGMCLGFYEEKRNGQHIIGHGGDTNYFHSDLHLMLDAGVGFFVSYNSRGSGEISPRTALWEQFLDRYFPYTVPAAHPPANAVDDAKLVAGQYRASRSAFTTVLSFIQLAGQLTVSATPEGDILTDDFKTLSGQPKRWQEIAPLVYREVGGQDLIAFNRNPEGGLRASIDFPFEVFDRVSFVDGKSFNLSLISFTAIVGLLAFLAWPVAAWTRRHYRRPLVLTTRQRTAYSVVHLVGLLDVLFFAGWLTILMAIEKNPGFAGPSLNAYLRLLQVLGWLSTLGTLAVIYAVTVLRGAENRWWLAKVGYGAVVLACVSFSWLVYHWHLLHWSLRF